MPPSPNRIVRCAWKRCKRLLEPGEARLTYAKGGRQLIALCPWHFSVIDGANRLRFWRRHRMPQVYAARVEDGSVVNAYYLQKVNEFSVTQIFADLEPEQQVYVLSHETLHWVLARDFGLLTSISLDIFYKQPLHVLGHHSLHTWELNRLYEQPKL